MREPLTPAEGMKLLDLGIGAVRRAFRTGVKHPIWSLTPAGLPPRLRTVRGGFVTLYREGIRQGCMGEVVPHRPDCKCHLNPKKGEGEDTMIFITEGQSAGGTITTARNAQNQAVFFLKGKPLNVCNLKRDALYKNQEIYNLMKSLDIEESTDRLRYQKVIFATDADVDGLHIRNLLITLFMRFFEPIVRQGHVYILETPLFRVRERSSTSAMG